MKPLDFPSHHGPANELLNHIRSCYISFGKIRFSKQIFEARATISNSESDPLSRHAEKTSSRRTIFNPSIPKAKRIIYESDRIEANVNLQLMMCLLLLLFVVCLTPTLVKKSQEQDVDLKSLTKLE